MWPLDLQSFNELTWGRKKENKWSGTIKNQFWDRRETQPKIKHDCTHTHTQRSDEQVLLNPLKTTLETCKLLKKPKCYFKGPLNSFKKHPIPCTDSQNTPTDKKDPLKNLWNPHKWLLHPWNSFRRIEASRETRNDWSSLETPGTPRESSNPLKVQLNLLKKQQCCF